MLKILKDDATRTYDNYETMLNERFDGTIINESPRTLLQKGMQSFRSLDVPPSLTYFDQADALANALTFLFNLKL